MLFHLYASLRRNLGENYAVETVQGWKKFQHLARISSRGGEGVQEGGGGGGEVLEKG